MPPVTRRDVDLSKGLDSAPPTVAITASPNVFTTGIPTVRRTDEFEPHARPFEAPHQRWVLKGSTTVFVNGLNIARIDDPLTDGDEIAQGAPTVIAGG